ncbi:MAG: J domain-containing protein [Cyanobacteria bacterium J06641_5]
MADKPIPPPQPDADFPPLEWRSLRGMRSQLPVGNYSQYEFAFSRASDSDDDARLWVHAIRGRDAYMSLVTMGFQVSAEPVGFAAEVDGEVGFYLAPDVLAWVKQHGESLEIPIASYQLFSKTGLPLCDRIWFVGIDALRGYFRQRSQPVGQGQQQDTRDRDWFWQRVKARGSWEPPFQKELQLLGLDKMPTTLAELKIAWKERLRVSHPDVGGNTEQAQEIGAAFETLRSHLESWS